MPDIIEIVADCISFNRLMASVLVWSTETRSVWSANWLNAQYCLSNAEGVKGWHRVCVMNTRIKLWAGHGMVGPARPYYQLSALESWTWGSQPLTVLYVPGSPLHHGRLSVGSDSKATDQSPTPTPRFGSSLIRQPTRACSSAMWSVLLWLYWKVSGSH